MARKQPVQTFHPSAVAASIEAQSMAVMQLIQAARNALEFSPDMPGAKALADAADTCQAVMYPEG